MIEGLRFGVIGRSEWLYETVLRLVKAGHKPTFIVTSREAPEYRRTADDFRDLSEELGVPFLRTANLSSPAAQEFLDSAGETDCVVSVNYSSVIGDDVISRYSIGVLNAHGGDLPRYRGNACQAWAILNGEPSVAMCIHRMVPDEVDSGDIIARSYLPTPLGTKVGEIYAWFGEVVPSLYAEALANLVRDRTHVVAKQSTDPKVALRCYPRRPDDGLIDWSMRPEDVVRLVCASGPPFVGAFSFIDGNKVFILDAEVYDDGERFCAVPGQVLEVDQNKGRVVVCAGRGKVVLSALRAMNGSSLPISKAIKSIRSRFVSFPIDSVSKKGRAHDF